MKNLVDLENQFNAHYYAPLPVALVKGEGALVWDLDGKRYIDMMSAYSAVSHGHCHPEIIATLIEQAQRLNIVSRAYYTDVLGPFLQTACQLTGMQRATPLNTGAEAVETAIKAARKWAYTVKDVADNQAEIIACEGNFHGRTISIISMSSETQYRQGFGPFVPGFKLIPYGDVDALAQAITPNTAAFLVEPIQGEAGIVLPPAGYLRRAAEICRQHNVLLICDEIQCGLGRTGKVLACEHEGVQPDGLILGKALGGGVLPVSLFLANDEVMDVFHAGDHGSTFGGNPLGAKVAHKALEILARDNLAGRAAELGDYFIAELHKFDSKLIKEIRGLGLFIGIEIDPKQATAREICLQLLEAGLLSKETHATVVRLAPPLVISKALIDEALAMLRTVLV